MTRTLDWAQGLQKFGVPIVPLAPGTRVGLQGTHYDDMASLDPADATNWWTENPDYNLGAYLKYSGILMLDIDNDRDHAKGTDGVATLKRLIGEGKIGPMPATYWETSPSGGCHFFFTYSGPEKLTSGQELFGPHSGIDYNAVMVPVAPSRYNGGQCVPGKGKKWSDICEAPDWLIAEIQRQQAPRKSFTTNFARQPQSWTGELLDKIVAGTDKGERNGWITSVTGSLIHTGMDADNMLTLIKKINKDFVRPPLTDRELLTVVNSIAKREAARTA